MSKDEEGDPAPSERSNSTSDNLSPTSSTSSQPRVSTDEDRPSKQVSPSAIGLVCVSGESEFDVIRTWGDVVSQVFELSLS
jgi:hypothetical protein